MKVSNASRADLFDGPRSIFAASLRFRRLARLLTWKLRIAILVCLAILQGQLMAQEPEFTLNVNVDLVELSVTVLDEDDRFVPGLDANDFEVFEDDIRQELSLFLHEDRAVSLGLVIDNSRSMERKRARVEAAARSFLHLSNPEDEAFLIYFDDSVRLAQDFTSDFAKIDTTLSSISPYGQTALFDAVVRSVEQVEKGRYSGKAILLVTDGADNASRAAYKDVLERVRKSGAMLYAIGILSNSVEAANARALLESLAAASGGRAFFPTAVEEVPALTRRIARELRELYTLGYVPTNPSRDGSWRSVRVYLDRSPTVPRRVSYRHGYYAPRDP